MIATFVMNGDWIELPINIGVEREKIENRIQANDKTLDGFGALYDSICITADEDNQQPVLISDYTEENQVNDGTRCDYIELNPSAEIHLPWNTQVSAFNRPLVCGADGDVIKVVAR